MMIIAILFLSGLFLWHGFNNLSWILPVYYVLLSIWTYLLYAWDKFRAVHGGWRISEYHLHLFALLGGWPGALLAQQSLRHKTIKPVFRRWFWLSVAINLIVLFGLEYFLFIQ